MCGITGIVNFNHPQNGKGIVRKMNKKLVHRGPDDEGIFVSRDNRAVFGFRRLAIVDVDNGRQPIELIHNQKQYAIVCNGEIYNHKRIRKTLERRGHSFRTGSDMEVLLASYIEWKEGCVKRFNGAFSFAIYDGKDNSVVLARDRLGIKPLFYTILQDGTLIFSSEPKAILIHPQFRAEPDNMAIAEFFLGTYSFPSGSAPLDRSFFKGIHSLGPATVAIFKGNQLEFDGYWDVSIEKNEGNHVERIREEVRNAVIMRIPDEVRFGTALSGGLDSSIVTSIAELEGGPVTAATVSLGDSENPDHAYASRMAWGRQIRLVTAELRAEDIISDMDDMISAMDEPHDAIRQLSLFAVYRALRKAGCKVALVGEGADEFNMGYYHFYSGFGRDMETCRSSGAFRAALKRRASRISEYFTDEFLGSVDFDELIDFQVTNYYDRCQSYDPVDRMQYFYIKKFLKYRLDANDRCSMAHSVEARVPFCDHNVVQASLRVPNDSNLKNGTEKCVLREAFRDILPKEIAERRKYPLPEDESLKLQKLISDELEKNIESADPGIWRILNREAIIQLNKKFREKIGRLERDGEIQGRELTKEDVLGEKTGIRTKHVFGILTLIRWFQIYFAQT